jgi:molecular chaperone GrpE
LAKKKNIGENDKEQIPDNTVKDTAQEQSAQPDDQVKEQENAPEANPLEEQLKAEHDRYLRLAAEYDNFRKRSLKERENMYNDVKSDTISKLLPIYDNLERALAVETSDEAYKKGVEMIMTQLKDIFSKMGVKEIEAVGKPFDPSMHNAVMHIEDETLDKNIVAEEFAKGFTLGDKVIRFSMVKVAN